MRGEDRIVGTRLLYIDPKFIRYVLGTYLFI